MKSSEASTLIDVSNFYPLMPFIRQLIPNKEPFSSFSTPFLASEFRASKLSQQTVTYSISFLFLGVCKFWSHGAIRDEFALHPWTAQSFCLAQFEVHLAKFVTFKPNCPFLVKVNQNWPSILFFPWQLPDLRFPDTLFELFDRVFVFEFRDSFYQ